MSLLSRLLGLWAVGKTVSSTTPLFMRLLLGMAAITLFAVFAAVLLALIGAGLVYVAYIQLMAHGFSEAHTLLIIGGVLVALLFATVMVVRYHWRRAYKLTQKILLLQTPITGRINRIGEAFMSGFHAH